MTRLLFWIALIILVVMAVRSKLRAAVARAQGPAGMGPGMGQPGGAQARGRVEDASERMTSCAYCGVYFPASEAVTAGGRDYCSPAHAHQPVIDKPPR
jgi:uncharacterized protein